jgi:hypothetical protein
VIFIRFSTSLINVERVSRIDKRVSLSACVLQ